VNKIGNDNYAGRRGRGRPKGSPNKLQKAAKDAIAAAAEALGGEARLAEWAKEAPENERAFWATIYPKLLPVQVNAEISGKMVSEVRHTIIDGAPD
jgi:hypothetical protein